MSRPWKSELSIRLGRSACMVQLCAPWSRRVLAQAQAEGAAADALPAALAALRAQGHDPLPVQARLLVPDERVYLSLRPAAGSWRMARQEASTHFAAVLGRQDLHVQVMALPVGSAWLAAALEPGDLQDWQRALADAGVRLAHVQLALLDDLRRIAAQVADDAVVALMREEGMTLLRVQAGVPVALSWERCDPRVLRLAEQRLLAFQGAGGGSDAMPLWMLCRSPAQCAQWQDLAEGHRWTLLSQADAAPPAPPAPAEVPA
ncbi:hypothetical protein [Variovorax sp. YR752]|uniref:hypothetical protein n=1 Tax=Variovorax sp. YR752 TaxID=1884383 RepID=UPI00313829F0